MLRHEDGLEHLGRLCARLGIVEQPLECREGRGLLRVAAEGGRVVLDRCFDIVDMILVELAELDTQRDRFVDGRDEAQPALVQIDDVVPAVLPAVQTLQRVDRICALGCNFQDLLPAADRFIGPLEVRVDPFGPWFLAIVRNLARHERVDLIVDIGAHLGRRLAQQHLDEMLLVVGLAIDALERGERAAIVGLDVEHLLVVLARHREIATDRAREVGDVEIQPPLDLRVEHVGRDGAVDIDQLGLATELAGEALGLRDGACELGLGRGVT